MASVVPGFVRVVRAEGPWRARSHGRRPRSRNSTSTSFLPGRKTRQRPILALRSYLRRKSLHRGGVAALDVLGTLPRAAAAGPPTSPKGGQGEGRRAAGRRLGGHRVQLAVARPVGRGATRRLPARRVWLGARANCVASPGDTTVSFGVVALPCVYGVAGAAEGALRAVRASAARKDRNDSVRVDLRAAEVGLLWAQSPVVRVAVGFEEEDVELRELEPALLSDLQRTNSEARPGPCPCADEHLGLPRPHGHNGRKGWRIGLVLRG